MKSVLPKILCVVIAIGSVVAMAISLVAHMFFGAEPDSVMKSRTLQDYSFTVTAGESPKWVVERRGNDGGSVGQFDTPYEAIVRAYRHQKQTSDTANAAASSRLDAVRSETQTLSAEHEKVVAAMDQRIAALNQYSEQLSADLESQSAQLQTLITNTNNVRDETTRRRQDVVRLQNELQEIRTDLFRLEELRRVLTDRLVRLQLDNRKLQVRRNSLEALTSN